MESVILVFRKHPVEITLILVSIVITGIITFLYSPDSNSTDVSAVNESPPLVKDTNTTTFTIDISGAVMKPDVYSVDSHSTLNDVIKKAGGFSKDAATDYIGRNFNLAKNITDKEKIYIPTQDDIANGLFEENNILTVQKEINDSETEETGTNGISVNSASLEELDTLSGVGPVTAQKIIDNRPYETIEDLVTKKAINNTTLNKIKDLISL